MRRVLLICIVQQLLCFISRVESLKGKRVSSAAIGEFPFIASLQYYPQGQHFCSGTLVTTKYVVTSAHCMDDETPDGIRIVFGVLNSRSPATHHAVSSWLTYDDWADDLGIQIEPIFHDIAIITLVNHVNEPNVSPVSLSELNKLQVQGKPATFVGWRAEGNAEVLHKATVKILSDEECTNNIRLITNDLQESSARLLCSQAKPFALTSEGDSGGPIVDRDNKLLGVTFGDCPDPKHAWCLLTEQFLQPYLMNLHFSVDYYRNFIVNVTGYH